MFAQTMFLFWWVFLFWVGLPFMTHPHSSMSIEGPCSRWVANLARDIPFRQASTATPNKQSEKNWDVMTEWRVSDPLRAKSPYKCDLLSLLREDLKDNPGIVHELHL